MARRYVKASADKLKFFQAQFDSACTMRDRYKSELERSQAELKTNLSKVGDESESIARVSGERLCCSWPAFQGFGSQIHLIWLCIWLLESLSSKVLFCISKGMRGHCGTFRD